MPSESYNPETLPGRQARAEKQLRKARKRGASNWILFGNYPTDPGTDEDSTPLLNGWLNVGFPKPHLQWRWTADQGFEIVGSIYGGDPGTVVATLPDLPWLSSLPGDLPIHAHDQTGTYVAFTLVAATRQLIHGTT